MATAWPPAAADPPLLHRLACDADLFANLREFTGAVP